MKLLEDQIVTHSILHLEIDILNFFLIQIDGFDCDLADHYRKHPSGLPPEFKKMQLSN